MAQRAAMALCGAAAAAALRGAACALSAAAIASAPAAAFAQADPYRQHMENGIKLFQDKNYEAAIVEFEAAYKVKPKASPLFNIALAQKALFNYPKAIAALELALSKHTDTLDEGDETTAREAIAEMRALLARLTIEVRPASATLFIDGEAQPASTQPSRVVELGPGVHRIGASADGYASAEQSVTLVSGERDQLVKLALVADKGYVTVAAGDPAIAIAIDQKFVAYGQWGGLLSPGTHLVQIYRPTGVIYSAQVLVIAGKSQEVGPGYGGVPTGAGAVAPAVPVVQPPPPPPPPKPRPPEPPRRGFFVLGAASLLWPLSTPVAFPSPETNSGGAGALRFGYRVNNPASFDLMLQYVNIGIESTLDQNLKYTFSSGRFGVNLRLMTTGHTARLVGSLGGGLVYDDVSFTVPDPARCACKDASGLDPFVLTDLGLELDLGGVLLGFSLEGYFQSSRGIEDDEEATIFRSAPLIHLGGSVRVGYAFW